MRSNPTARRSPASRRNRAKPASCCAAHRAKRGVCRATPRRCTRLSGLPSPRTDRGGRRRARRGHANRPVVDLRLGQAIPSKRTGKAEQQLQDDLRRRSGVVDRMLQRTPDFFEPAHLEAGVNRPQACKLLIKAGDRGKGFEGKRHTPPLIGQDVRPAEGRGIEGDFCRLERRGNLDETLGGRAHEKTSRHRGSTPRSGRCVMHERLHGERGAEHCPAGRGDGAVGRTPRGAPRASRPARRHAAHIRTGRRDRLVRGQRATRGPLRTWRSGSISAARRDTTPKTPSTIGRTGTAAWLAPSPSVGSRRPPDPPPPPDVGGPLRATPVERPLYPPAAEGLSPGRRLDGNSL